MTDAIGLDSPFIYGRMITDPNMFWGRYRESYELRARLQNMQSTSIVGPRRIGKSSLAYFVYKTAPEVFDNAYKFVWLDGQSNHANSVQDFCLSVASKSSLAYVPTQDHKSCLMNFEDAVLSYDKKLVLIINEFELLTDENHKTEFDIQFFNTFRLLAEQGLCALITTSNQSIQDLCKHVLGISSPFYNILSQITLSAFSDEEAQGFLDAHHNGILLETQEKELIKCIPNFRHPLLLQIACHHFFQNRINNLPKEELIRNILKQEKDLTSHDDVHKERIMAKGASKKAAEEKQLSKPVDMFLSFLLPIIAIGLLMLEFFLVIQTLDITKTIILAIFSALVGFAVIVFAGRSINIIGETSFFKLFVRLIEQIPLLSNVLTTITNVVKKPKKIE
jgi:hypothetical protein